MNCDEFPCIPVHLQQIIGLVIEIYPHGLVQIILQFFTKGLRLLRLLSFKLVTFPFLLGLLAFLHEIGLSEVLSTLLVRQLF